MNAPVVRIQFDGTFALGESSVQVTVFDQVLNQIFGDRYRQRVGFLPFPDLGQSFRVTALGTEQARVPVNEKVDARAATFSPSIFVSAVSSSSARPSQKYSLSGSVLMFENGNTAIEFLFRVSLFRVSLFRVPPSGGRPVTTCVLVSAEEPPEGGTLNEERIAVGGSWYAGP